MNAVASGHCLESYLCKCYETRAKKGHFYGEIMECQLGSYEVRIGRKLSCFSKKKGVRLDFSLCEFSLQYLVESLTNDCLIYLRNSANMSYHRVINTSDIVFAFCQCQVLFISKFLNGLTRNS